MTRRERMERLIGHFNNKQREWSICRVILDLGLEAFTDEAIDLVAADVVDGWRRSQKMNRRNRAIYAARQKMEAEHG